MTEKLFPHKLDEKEGESYQKILEILSGLTLEQIDKVLAEIRKTTRARAVFQDD